MRTGLLGGTFDPPHNGHLHMARAAQDQLALDRVLFIPCHHQPLKAEAPGASPFHRAAMVALALSGRGDWTLEPLELERGGISYTAETVEALPRRHPGDEFVLILGEDSFRTLGQWYRYEAILETVAIAVVPREEASGDPPSGARATWLRCEPLSVSSTELRARLAAGRRIDDLTPAAVADYIVKQHLYTGCFPGT